MSSAARLLTQAGASVRIFAEAPTACRWAADQIARTVRAAIAERGQAVLGLATGGTPVVVYARLVELHNAGELSFARVATYNLDEFYPIEPLDPRSYRSYMYRHFFSHVDIMPNRAHVLDGSVPEAFAAEHAAAYDRWIAADGGLDLQLLGIGRNGHIGFNEPSPLTVSEALSLPTRLADLHPVTVADTAKDFGGDAGRVPRRALTAGVATILAARSILIVALGPAKAEAVAQALRGPMTAELPASLLQSVPGKVTWVLDEAASGRLSR